MRIEEDIHIAIIIPFFQNILAVQNCVRSIEEQEGGSEKIVISILIIDNSKMEIDLNLSDKSNCKVIRTKPAIGFARSVNIGIKRALDINADYCLILNQDTILSPACIETLVYSLTGKGKIDTPVVSPLVIDEQSKNIPGFHKLEYFQDYRGDFIEPFKIKNYQGCSFMINLRRYGFPFLDPLYHMYYEDEDFLNRLQSGDDLKIWIIPKAFVFHRNQGDLHLAQEETQRNIWKLKSKIIFHLRHSINLDVNMILRHWIKSWFTAFKTFKLQTILFSLGQDLNIIRSWNYIRNFKNQDITEKAMDQIRKDVL